MTKGQFAALTAALGLATMASAGYIAYASSGSHNSSSNNASSSGTGSSNGMSGANGGAIVPSGGAAKGTSGASPEAGNSGASGTTPACGNADIQVTTTDDEGATGHLSMLLVFTDSSDHDCLLHGYPGASLLGPKGADLLDATRTLYGFAGGAVGATSLSSVPHVLLHPGATASAVLEWSDVPTGSGCAVQNAVALAVTPPNTTQTTQIALSGQTEVCAEFQIHPVLSGVKRTP